MNSFLIRVIVAVCFISFSAYATATVTATVIASSEDDLPNFTDLFNEVFSKCGLVAAIWMFIAGVLAWQLTKTRAAWEADRANTEKLREADRINYMRIIEDGNKAYSNLAVSNSRLEGLVLGLQNAARNHNDD